MVSWVEDARRHAEIEGDGLGLRYLLDAVLPPDPRTPEEVLGFAIHEAAHAVVALALGVPVKRLAIGDRDDRAGAESA